MAVDESMIDWKDTLIRILVTVLLAVISEIVKWVIWVAVAVQLLFALVTGRQPSFRLRRFANQAVSYQYRLLRYVTYNDPDRPFPFDDFPPEVEKVER